MLTEHHWRLLLVDTVVQVGETQSVVGSGADSGHELRDEQQDDRHQGDVPGLTLVRVRGRRCCGVLVQVAEGRFDLLRFCGAMQGRRKSVVE